MAPTFAILSEQQQREVFKSVRIGEAQSKAKIELLRYELDPNKHGRTKALKEDIKEYQGLFNIIKPKDF